MTDKEIVQALHICGEGRPCRDCQLYGKEISCVETLCKYALDLIERLTAENAALREKQRWIPVTERMPEPETDVLAVCNRNGYIIGDFNYYVMPLEVYEKVRDELPYSVGVLCPEKLGYKFLPYILKVVQRVRRIDRKRSLQEMLLMMWRSSRREIVKARKEVNGNDEP